MADSVEKRAEKVRNHFDSLGIRQADVMRKTGTQRSEVSKTFSGAKPFGRKFAERLSIHYNISATYLMTGIGEFLLPTPADDLSPVTGNETPEHLDTISSEARLAVRVEELEKELDAFRLKYIVAEQDNEQLRKSLAFAISEWQKCVEDSKKLSRQIDCTLKLWSEQTGICKSELEQIFRAGENATETP